MTNILSLGVAIIFGAISLAMFVYWFFFGLPPALQKADHKKKKSTKETKE